jgi:hypothetical protein
MRPISSSAARCNTSSKSIPYTLAPFNPKILARSRGVMAGYPNLS